MKTIDAVLRHEARRNGFAVPRASHQRVVIRPDAMVVSVYAIANEHRSFQGFWLDTIGNTDPIHVCANDTSMPFPVFHSAFDSRRPNDAFDLLESMAGYMNVWFDRFADQGFPQLIVPARSDWSLLREVILRARNTQRDHPRPEVERLAARLGFHVQQAEIAGQQSVVNLTAVLADLYAIGLPPADQAHLGVTLEWFNATPPTLDLIEAAETLPAGVRTSPQWDNDLYLTAIADVNKARRELEHARAAGKPTRRVQHNLDRAARLARDLLWDQVAHQLEWTRRGLRLLTDATIAMPPLPSIADRVGPNRPTGLASLERADWLNYQQRLNDLDAARAAWHVARAGTDDNAKDAAWADLQAQQRHFARRAPTWSFESRQSRNEAFDKRVLIEDRYARADARLAGTTAEGEVIASRHTRVPNPDPTKRNQWWRTTVTIRSRQELVNFGAGAAVGLVEPTFADGHSVPAANWTVVDVQPDPRHGWLIEVTLISGRAPRAVPPVGDRAELLGFGGTNGMSLNPYQLRASRPVTHTARGHEAVRLAPAPAGPAAPAHLPVRRAV